MPSLHHEHLVRINDPANVIGRWLTRAELWHGLLQTMLAPKTIDASIDSSVVREAEPNRLEREIRRGKVTTLDWVELCEDDHLTVHADGSSAFAGSTLRIQIEEPAPGMLFVRFTYDLCGLEDERTDEEDQARRSAYQASDIERVRQARRLTEIGDARH